MSRPAVAPAPRLIKRTERPLRLISPDNNNNATRKQNQQEEQRSQMDTDNVGGKLIYGWSGLLRARVCVCVCVRECVRACVRA